MVELARKVKIKHPVDPDHVDIQEDPFHPTAYIVTLPLDSDHCYVWHTLFQQGLWSSLDFWDRKVLVVGKALKLVTTPERVAEKVQWLEGLVAATNNRVEEYNKRENASRKAGETKLLHEAAIRKDLSRQFGRIRG